MKPTPEQIKQIAIEFGAISLYPHHVNIMMGEKQYTEFFTRAYELGWKNRGESDEQIAMNWPDDCVLDVAEAIRNNTGE